MNDLIIENQVVDAGESLKPKSQVNDLIIEDLVVGTGELLKQKDKIVIHYKGMLLDGTVFDSSYDRDEALECKIGVGKLIRGWDVGCIGMQVGGKRKLTIPYMQAYGELGYPPIIPPCADLVFELELLEIILS
jgi:peptidylprolyl isomerase